MNDTQEIFQWNYDGAVIMRVHSCEIPFRLCHCYTLPCLGKRRRNSCKIKVKETK